MRPRTLPCPQANASAPESIIGSQTIGSWNRHARGAGTAWAMSHPTTLRWSVSWGVMALGYRTLEADQGKDRRLTVSLGDLPHLSGHDAVAETGVRAHRGRTPHIFRVSEKLGNSLWRGLPYHWGRHLGGDEFMRHRPTSIRAQTHPPWAKVVWVTTCHPAPKSIDHKVQARKAFHLLSSPTIPTDPPFQLPQHQEPGTQYPLPTPEYTASQDPDGKGGKYVEQRSAKGLR